MPYQRVASEWRHAPLPICSYFRAPPDLVVTIALTDGTELGEHVQAVRGTADNPMPRDEVIGKCRDLMAPVLGAAQCTALTERVLALENTADLQELRPLPQKPG